LGAKPALGNFHKENVVVTKLGRGVFASVYAVRKAGGGGAQYAAKVVSLRGANGKLCRRTEHMAQCEYEILRKVAAAGSDHIVKVFNGFREGAFMCMVMEKCEEALFDAFDSFRDLTEEKYRPLLRCMLRGIAAVHAVGVVHRDVKPDNFLCVADGHRKIVKLCDFGLASTVATAQSCDLRGLNGTPLFMAPEMLRGSRYNAQVDVWSFGVILYALLFGHFPYMPKLWTGEEMKRSIKRGKPSPIFVPRTHCRKSPEAPGAISISATILAVELLERAQRARLTAEKALQHEFFRRKVGPRTSLRPMLLSAEFYGAFGPPRRREDRRPSTLDLKVAALQLQQGHDSPWSRCARSNS